MKNKSVINIIDAVAFILALLASAVAMFVLFYRQAFSDSVTWLSDMPAYISEMLGTNTKFSFPYPVLFKTAKLINYLAPSPEFAMALAVTLLNILAMIIVKIVFTKQTNARLLATFAIMCLFFCSMIYSDLFKAVGIPERYAGVYSPNPWHNHTYMAARPFMILAFVMGAIVLQNYEKDFAKSQKITKDIICKYVVFACSILLVTLAKPSYTIVHMASSGIVMLYRLFKNSFKTLRQTVFLGICYIPTIIDLLYQFGGVFTGTSVAGDENGIGIALFEVWREYSHNIPISIVLAAAFPLVVLLFHWRDIKSDYQYRYSWQVYLAGLIMGAILVEKGFREYHGNFLWGYICGLFIVFMSSIVLVLRDTIKVISEKLLLTKAMIKPLVEWGFLGVHTLLGLKYFYELTVYGCYYL